MSTYLELVEKEFELGLLTKAAFNSRKRMYNKMNKMNKDKFDMEALGELNLLTNDKDFFIQAQVLSTLKSIKQSNSEIKGWVTFMGIMMILSILVALMTISEF